MLYCSYLRKIIKTVIHLNKRWITVLFILNLTVTDFIAIETGTVVIIDASLI